MAFKRSGVRLPLAPPLKKEKSGASLCRIIFSLSELLSILDAEKALTRRFERGKG